MGLAGAGVTVVGDEERYEPHRSYLRLPRREDPVDHNKLTLNTVAVRPSGWPSVLEHMVVFIFFPTCVITHKNVAFAFHRFNQTNVKIKQFGGTTSLPQGLNHWRALQAGLLPETGANRSYCEAGYE